MVNHETQMISMIDSAWFCAVDSSMKYGTVSKQNDMTDARMRTKVTKAISCWGEQVKLKVKVEEKVKVNFTVEVKVGLRYRRDI